MEGKQLVGKGEKDISPSRSSKASLEHDNNTAVVKQKLVSDKSHELHMTQEEIQQSKHQNVSSQTKVTRTLSPLTSEEGMTSKNSQEQTPHKAHYKKIDLSPSKGSPSRSPSYVRKPLPINEPKPILPKSKQLKMESGSFSPLPIIRASVIEEGNYDGETVAKIKAPNELMRKNSKAEDSCKNINIVPKLDDEYKEHCNNHHALSKKASPLSPKLTERNRPSTLTLEKKERVKRSSAVSATPSTDSSKSSKMSELDPKYYDPDTRERILAEALRVEDEFLEYIKTLDIKPDPIIEAGKARDKKQVGHPFRNND